MVLRRIRAGRWAPAPPLLIALAGLAWFSGAAGVGVAEAQQAATNPHGDIAIPCTDCHTTASWKELRDPLPFEHKKIGFPLVEGHGFAACGACHDTLVFEHVATSCADCHSDAHRAELGFGCETCHSPAGWQDRRNMFIFHFTTLFPLLGGHATLDCDSCHRAAPPFEYTNTPTDCASCHATDFANTVDPDHTALGFPADCELCHQVDGWQAETIPDHELFFPLTGAHAQLDCQGCHADGFAGTPTECYDCHATVYNTTTNPDHALANIPTDCEICHTTDRWGGAEFVDHESFFALTGAHAILDCSECHADGFQDTPTDCFSCHADQYNATTNPDHALAGFGTTCETCHTTDRWEGADFDHDDVFTLVGAHRKLDCEQCHSSGFAGTPTDCFSCHKSDYNQTRDPDHDDAGFPTDCELCHNERKWEGADFDHDNFFALNGKHKKLYCEECHASGYAGTPTDCYSCHTSEYDNTTDPDHASAGFPTDCEACHNEVRWDGATFEHDTFFVLKGKHKKLECDDCHSSGFAGTPTDCFSCHAAEYNGTTDPDHAAAGFPTDCEACHSETKWDGASFDHATFFVLKGAHKSLECDDCHSSGFAGTPTDCFSCHAAEYNGTTDPDHAAAGFPTDCELCHSENKWDGASFDHSTFFVLKGKHKNLDCEECHASGYAGTPTDCFSCHQSEYDSTTDPNHAAAGFPTDCEVCHNENKWDGASFNHSTFFVLTGAHTSLDCDDCHASGFAGTPTDCFSCHQSDYNNTNDPNHSASGFPTDCELCHNTSDWDDADFGDHDAQYFPIFSGKHKGEWNDCSECHTQPNNFAAFSCLNCHEHNQSKMDDKHKKVDGYQYVSTSCLQCHPNGDEGDGGGSRDSGWWHP